MTWWSVTSLRWHYPDQVIRVFSAFTKKGTPSRLVAIINRREDGNVQRTRCKRGKTAVLQYVVKLFDIRIQHLQNDIQIFSRFSSSPW